MRLSAVALPLTILLFSSSLITKTPGCDAQDINRPPLKRLFTTVGRPVDTEEKKDGFRTNKKQERANSCPKSFLESSPGTCPTTIFRPVEEEPRGSTTQRTLCLVESVVGAAESTNHGGCTAMEAKLLTQLKQLSRMHSIIHDCLQRILTDIFGSPDSASKDVCNKATRGVKLLEDGLRNLNEAKNLLDNDGFTY